jgi:hypothetical protein
MHKKNCKQYGNIPAKLAKETPWESVCVNLVGPWSVETPSGVKKLRAFTNQIKHHLF